MDMAQLKLLLDGKNDICDNLFRLAQTNATAAEANRIVLERIEKKIVEAKATTEKANRQIQKANRVTFTCLCISCAANIIVFLIVLIRILLSR